MSYIGSTPTTQNFIAGTDSFNGNGSATNFTLSRFVNSTNDIQVVVNNVVQYPPNYSVSGNTLTISPAPSSGTNNVYVRYLSTTLQSITVPGGSTVVGGFNVTGNVGVGTSLPAPVGGRNLQVSDRSAFFQLTVNNSTYLCNNLYYDGTNWRYIVSGAGSLFALDSTGSTAIYRATSGTAGAIAALINVIQTDGSTFQFNSGYGNIANAYGCRAWVNFNGTGTVAIRASGNVSSITDNGTGDYTVNFTTAMPDANFASQFTQGNTDGTSPPGNLSFGLRSVSTTTCRVNLRDSAGNQTDMPSINVSIFR